MQSDTLRILYYAFFQSIIRYGNIAWGGALSSNLNLLQNTQNRILKIINKNIFYKENPLNLKQIFAYECVLYYYIELSNVYAVTTSKTRNKFIRPPKCTKAVSDKSITI